MQERYFLITMFVIMLLSASFIIARCLCGSKRDKFTTETPVNAEIENAGIPIFPKTISFSS